MKIYYSPKFAKEYKRLPKKTKNKAEVIEKIFRQNPFDSRLKTHKLSGKLNQFWSFSINHQYHIVFEIVSKNTIWFLSVGTHQIYR
ncbi:type II toxin-antitoxin system mRNA interferase toxin, RelE/StbE family [Patescibacteria group bacterium]|nr:type II toxin-antitoxin system mRNA interferase toxin, RelE/StbE family [Patescibacteria group bacterium]